MSYPFEIQDNRLKVCLLNIEESLKSLWNERILHQHYTNHGLDHSQRTKEILINLLKDYPQILNEYESFILLTAVLLHDIGMQLPEYSNIKLKTQYSFEELEIIRNNHHEASAKCILDSISKSSNLSLGLENCKEFVHEISEVTRNHRQVKLDYIKDSSIAGVKIRRKLISALLRIGDELDQDFRRINMIVLNIFDLPPLSKFHWWSHHYIQSILVDKGHIKIYFRFPESFKTDKRWQPLFQEKVEESIKNTFLEVFDILYENNIRLYKAIEIGRIRYASKGEILEPPDDLKDFLSQKVISPQEKIEEVSNRISFELYLDGIPYSKNEETINCVEDIAAKLDREEYDDAACLIERCKTDIRSKKDKLVLLLMAGTCYLNLGKYDVAEIYLNEIFELSKRRNLRVVYANIVSRIESAATNNLGIIKLHQGDFKFALELFENAETLAKKLENLSLASVALDNRGVVYQRLGLLEDALRCHFKANQMYKQLKNKIGGAKSYGNIACVYLLKNESEEAIRYSKRALRLFKSLDNKSGEAEELQTIGLIYSQKENYKSALINLASAYSLFYSIGFKRGLLTTKYSIALVLLEKERYDSCLRILNRILSEYQEIKNIDRVVDIYTSIGDVYYFKREFQTSLEYYNRCIENIKYATFETKKKVYSNIALLYSELNDYKKAQKYFEQILNEYPNDIKLIGGYAFFAYTKLNDIELAKKLFISALELDSKNPNNLVNYAGFLLSQSDSNGFKILDDLNSMSISGSLARVINLERNFYLFLHEKPNNPNPVYLKQIKQQIQGGVRSVGMNYKPNLEEAVRENHKHIEFIHDLARVITKAEEIDILKSYEIWSNL